MGFLEKDDTYDTLDVKTKQINRDTFPILPDREIFRKTSKYRAERQY